MRYFLGKHITFDTKREYLEFLKETICKLVNYSENDRLVLYPSYYNVNNIYYIDMDNGSFLMCDKNTNNYLIYNYKDLDNPINKKEYSSIKIKFKEDELYRLLEELKNNLK